MLEEKSTILEEKSTKHKNKQQNGTNVNIL